MIKLSEYYRRSVSGHTSLWLGIDQILESILVLTLLIRQILNVDHIELGPVDDYLIMYGQGGWIRGFLCFIMKKLKIFPFEFSTT